MKYSLEHQKPNIKRRHLYSDLL